jgi:tubulin-specific chaperone B
LQEKLHLITGIPVENQQLAIYNNDADLHPVRVLDEDQRPLGFYSPADFQVLKVRGRVLGFMQPLIVNPHSSR